MNISEMSGQQLIDYINNADKQFTIQELKDIVQQASGKVEGKGSDVTYLLYNGQFEGEKWTGKTAEEIASGNRGGLPLTPVTTGNSS